MMAYSRLEMNVTYPEVLLQSCARLREPQFYRVHNVDVRRLL